jgi:hypothetical protein
MKTRGWILAAMVILAAFARLIPHPPNFAPICAMAFFGGVQFRSRLAAFLVPLLAMFLSDVALEIIGRLHLFESWLPHVIGFYPDMWVVYAAIALTAAIGVLVQRRRSLPAITGGVLASSLLYFVITNFGYWAISDQYPHTLAGLQTCFVMAIPFYQWSFAGDVFFSAVLFGGITLAELLNPRLQLAVEARRLG